MGMLCRSLVVVVVIVVLRLYLLLFLQLLFLIPKKLSFFYIYNFAKVASGSTSPDYRGNHSKCEEFVTKSFMS